ncbi:MAG: hypothetical protein JNL32_02040 [Candidatus Kapabacteria bacterium]|nr:hypothetical protein [Candidatus Kapabacteria bacterium]
MDIRTIIKQPLYRHTVFTIVLLCSFAITYDSNEHNHYQGLAAVSIAVMGTVAYTFAHIVYYVWKAVRKAGSKKNDDGTHQV